MFRVVGALRFRIRILDGWGTLNGEHWLRILADEEGHVEHLAVQQHARRRMQHRQPKEANIMEFAWLNTTYQVRMSESRGPLTH